MVFPVAIPLLPTLSGNCGDSEFEINSIAAQQQGVSFGEMLSGASNPCHSQALLKWKEKGAATLLLFASLVIAR